MRLIGRLWRRAGGRPIPDSRMALILRTPPIATEPLNDGEGTARTIGVHVLCQDAHIEPVLWTLKSFYHHAGVRYPLTVHLQGRNTTEARETVPRHFPQARLVTQEDADAVVEPWLESRGLHRLLALRRQLFLMMKMIDLRVMARTPLVVYFDTDVLFFRCPDRLTTWPDDLTTTPHLFMRDDYPSYCITPGQARADLGVDLVPFANAGVMRLVTDGLDLAACDRFAAHPSLAGAHWHLEQTLQALNASAQGRIELLPVAYGMADGLSANPGLVARHYCTPIRRLYADEGVAHLMDRGFLEELAA